MRREVIGTVLAAVVAGMIAGCSKAAGGRQELAVENAAYYWRTDLRLDTAERAFLDTYNINKVYCRYFDVVMSDGGNPKPNATIAFSDTLPEGVEMVPTVYITEDCMHAPHDSLATLIVRRILQMNETNDIHGVREIQIDCDYTSRSRKVYYDFLKAVRRETETNLTPPSTLHPPLRISTTIRLHQLSMPAPPVDYGVLMIYNTGDPLKFMERNPILDIRDVTPYLSRLDDYPLPLAAAWPVYQWIRNIHGVRVEHTVEAEEILRVKRAVEKERPGLSRSIITYHLDKDNINRYKPDTYEAIYHH